MQFFNPAPQRRRGSPQTS